MDQGSSGTLANLLSRLSGNNSFKQRMESHMRLVLEISRDKYAQEAAKEMVPVAELVQNNVDAIVDGDFNDNLLPYLVNWFSSDFFQWFEAPNCEKCNDSLDFIGRSIDIEGRQVEEYGCRRAPSCDYTFKFIRHNDPSILLHTRTGRCGEWAHCFYVFLLALNYDARIVYDSTDHVWNEVFSKTKGCWIHVDPCENTIDTPLLYEVGWSKKLQYCIAFSHYEVIDVTRRYVIDFEATKRIRNECDESWLENCLQEMTIDHFRYLESDRMRSDFAMRRQKEILDLKRLSTSPREIPDRSQLKGRKTGSIAWRIERGEYCPSSEKLQVISVIKCDNHAADGILFHLTYNCDKDVYRSSNADHNDKKSWSSLTYKYENVDYKYERDWKTSYIARYESCPAEKKGKIVWRLDLAGLDDFNRLEVLFCCKIYPGTNVVLVLTSYGSSTADKLADVQMSLNKKDVLTRNQLGTRVRIIDLVATLSGGDSNDDVAWQKPQLFRQTRGDDEDPMSIKFY